MSPRKVVTAEFLNELPANHKLQLVVDGYDTEGEVYMNVVKRARRLCCGIENEVQDRPQTIENILDTVDGNPCVFTIHVSGVFERFDLDIVLMVDKLSNYLCAIRPGGGGWKEVNKPMVGIHNSEQLNFFGAYFELPGGIMDARFNFGFASLMRALVGLQRGVRQLNNFMCVVVNLFEPIRFPVLANLFVTRMTEDVYQTFELPPNARRLASKWSKLSVAVRSYRASGCDAASWDFQFTDEDDGVFNIAEIDVNQNSKIYAYQIASILGMLLKKGVE